MGEIKIGVSPAYHISRYGDRFTPGNVAASLPGIRNLGFSSFQLEVFHPDTLSEWVKKGAGQVAAAAERENMCPSQFVGHFLLHGFGSAEELKSEFGVQEIRSCLEILACFPGCSVITLVLPAFRPPSGGLDREAYGNLWTRFSEKLKAMLRVAGDGGKRLALEIMPGSILGGTQGLLRLIDELESPVLGYNFDTGHAWASREAIELVPAMLNGRIFGTHLKDNDQSENLSLPPGRGTIPWDGLIENLLASGYGEGWDLEIRCESGRVQSEYETGLNFLTEKLKMTCSISSRVIEQVQ